MGKLNVGDDNLESITDVCTTYKELLKSEDFKRVIQIAIKKAYCYEVDVIMSLFDKLGKDEALSDSEKRNLVSFADNENIELVIQPILTKLGESCLPGTESLKQQKGFGEFLTPILAENGVETTRNDILELAGVDVSKRVSEAVNDTKDVPSRIKAWNELAGRLSIIPGKVKVTNSGINIESVGTFELEDDKDASYAELKAGQKGGLERLPTRDIWEKFQVFMGSWDAKYQENFLIQVMGMDIKEGETNRYMSASLSSKQYVSILSSQGYGVNIGRDSKATPCSVRRMQTTK